MALNIIIVEEERAPLGGLTPKSDIRTTKVDVGGQH